MATLTFFTDFPNKVMSTVCSSPDVGVYFPRKIFGFVKVTVHGTEAEPAVTVAETASSAT